MLNIILNIFINLIILNNISENCKDLIKGLCDKNTEKRIKSEQALKHPFFKNGINFSNLLKLSFLAILFYTI